MSHSNLAIHTNRDILNIKNLLLQNWESFLSGEQIPNKVRPEVYESWKRCQNYDVNPMQQVAPVTIKLDDLQPMLKESELYIASLPIIEQLNNQILGTEHLITLSDDSGRIIHLEGESNILKQAEEMNFIIGADWSEEVAGSNAIGTSLTIGKPVQIFSFEHFCKGVHPWVCSAAPIRDPISKKILGIIDLTGPSEFAQAHSLSVVQSISHIIEQNLLQNAKQTNDYLLNYYDNFKRSNPSSSLLLLNKDLSPIKADEHCLALFNCTNWKQVWNLKEFRELITIIEKQSETEWEWQFDSLQIKIAIRAIIHNETLMGYKLLFENIFPSHISRFRQQSNWNDIVTQSSAMENVVNKVMVVANTNVPIFITGESGTGKEVLSSSIHKNSDRKDEPFITVNCGAIPKHLIASELFGYEPGAFTGGNPKGKKGKFEEANGGTILLDEIGEMPIDLQVHLLRVLEEREVVRLGSSKPIPLNVRIIAATNQNIHRQIGENKFREDLYYRLNVIEVKLPPLRERKGDIPLLCQHFATKLAKEHKRPIPTFHHETLKLFKKYEWKGNIRELRNVIEFAILFNHNNTITIESLPKQFSEKLEDDDSFSHNDNSSFSSLEIEEKNKIKELLFETNGNISEVARRCRVARSTLYRKIKKYNL